MAPPPFFARTGAKACVTANVPRKFTSISCRPPSIHFGSVKSPPWKPTMPALLTRRSTSVAVAAAVAICAALLTSSWSGTTREPWRATSGSSVERLRAAAYTFFAPAATSASTMASPMPRLAPVTSAVLPESAYPMSTLLTISRHARTAAMAAVGHEQTGLSIHAVDNRPICLYCQGVPQQPRKRGNASAIGVRDRLLEAADRLFYQEGVRAVGIDRV